MTLYPGVYTFTSSAGLTGSLTLDAQGDANAEWVVQIASTLTTASAYSVLLINGANACNVFWHICSSATLGTGNTFAGNVIAQAPITVTTGCSVDGGLYALTAALTLDTNAVTQCQGSPVVASSTSIVSTTAASGKSHVWFSLRRKNCLCSLPHSCNHNYQEHRDSHAKVRTPGSYISACG